MLKFLTVMLLVLIFTGCSSMSKDECELANWNAIGYSKGATGHSISTFQEYQKDCAEHRVKPDYQAFKQGHYEGLGEFCSIERGMEMGSNGENYHTICQSSQFPAYNQGYQVGINLYCSYDRGVATGSKGDTANKQCPSENFPKFNEGYQVGINLYCSFDRGVSSGGQGQNYNNRCPSELFPKFNQGYKSGLQQYCTYANGFELGMTGKSINNNCPLDTLDFKTGFTAGNIRLNDINTLDEFGERLITLRKNIEREQTKIVRAEAQIVSSNSTPETRKRVLDNIKLYQQEISRLEFEYVEIEHQQAALIAKLNREDNERPRH